MKVSLIVVQGKPEGKVIPLSLPHFKIGRGEGCHLRPNNEQISRNHAEILVSEEQAILRDLGSRNGTYVNSKRLEAKSDYVLKNKDLVQVGPLTFAVSVQGAPVTTATEPTSHEKAERAMAKAGAIDELSNDDIDSWLVTDKDSPSTDRPSGVYTGETMTLSAYKESSSDSADAAPPAQAEESSAEALEEENASEADESDDDDIYDKLDDEGDEAADEMDEFADESNPFIAAKKMAESQSAPTPKKDDVDSSRAAEDILRKMMDRRRATN